MAEAALDAAGSHRTDSDLSLFDSITLVAGSMIGSGIFIVSAEIAAPRRQPGWLLAVWIVPACMTIVGGAVLRRAGRDDAAGRRPVRLPARGLRPVGAFLYGWTLFLVIQTGTIAAVAVAWGWCPERRSGISAPMPFARDWCSRSCRPPHSQRTGPAASTAFEVLTREAAWQLTECLASGTGHQ